MRKNKKQKSLKKGPEDDPKHRKRDAKKKRFDQRARFNEFGTSPRTKWG
jgi:hypothetical protein